jgi:hypothetical protein
MDWLSGSSAPGVPIPIRAGVRLEVVHDTGYLRQDMGITPLLLRRAAQPGQGAIVRPGGYQSFDFGATQVNTPAYGCVGCLQWIPD